MKAEKQAAILDVFSRGMYCCKKDGTIISFVKNKRGRARNPTPSRKGYHDLQVTLGGRRYCISAHHMVWLFFNGAYPEHLTINHKDFNKANNALDNLELLTHAENVAHAVRGGRLKAHPWRKLTAQFVREIRALRAGGTSVNCLAARYSLSPKAIRTLLDGKTYKEVA